MVLYDLAVPNSDGRNELKRKKKAAALSCVAPGPCGFDAQAG
jgi:hypothetical protein